MTPPTPDDGRSRSDATRGGPRDPVAIWFDRAKEAESRLALATKVIEAARKRVAFVQADRLKHITDVDLAAFLAEFDRAKTGSGNG